MRAEKYYDYRDENEKLKKHQHEMEEEVKRIATKLRYRIG